jgi:hypothetical protein
METLTTFTRCLRKISRIRGTNASNWSTGTKYSCSTYVYFSRLLGSSSRTS